MDALTSAPPDRWLPSIRDVVGNARVVKRLHGGEEAEVHQLETDVGAVVLHISPPWRSRNELAWVHRLLKHVKRHVPEAVAPLGEPGQTLLDLDGRCAAVYPFVEGTRLGREDGALRTHAARCLAAIHRSTTSDFDAPHPTPRNPPEADRPDALEAPDLDAWWQSSDASSLLRAPIHGDYYRGNLLCRDGRLVGVIDWHDARVAPLALELAAATFELCRTHAHVLHVERASEFIQAYRACGGPVPPHELAFLVPLMRVWIRDDAMRALAQSDAHNQVAYARRQIEAFQSLAHVHISLV